MPPIYDWSCSECQLQTDTVRSFADSEVVPDAEEISKGTYPEGVSVPDKCEHKWKKLIGKNIRAFRGPNWRGAKGYW